MNEDKNKLQKMDNKPSMLDNMITNLEKEKQEKALEKHLQNEVELERIKKEKVLKSQVAEHDLKVGQENLDGLTSEKRYYTHTQTVETGSGRIEIKVKGGDTKFIIPIVTIIGIIVIIVMAILFLKV